MIVQSPCWDDFLFLLSTLVWCRCKLKCKPLALIVHDCHMRMRTIVQKRIRRSTEETTAGIRQVEEIREKTVVCSLVLNRVWACLSMKLGFLATIEASVEIKNGGLYIWPYNGGVCWISATELFQRKRYKFFDLRCLLSTWQRFQGDQTLQRWDVT